MNAQDIAKKYLPHPKHYPHNRVRIPVLEDILLLPKNTSQAGKEFKPTVEVEFIKDYNGNWQYSNTIR